MDQFDVTVFHTINNLAVKAPGLNGLMIFFAGYALPIYAVLFVVAWFSLPRSDAKLRNSLFVSGCAGILALIVNVVIAHVWYRPRPFVVLPKGSFHELIPHVADASFPSDHVAGSFGFAAASWGAGPKWIQVSFTVVAVIVTFARVWVGLHWPTDVLAGVLVGTVAGWVMRSASPLLYPVTLFFARLFGFGPKRAVRSTYRK